MSGIKQSFTMFCKVNGFVDDYGVMLDHSLLSPSGHISTRNKKAAMDRMQTAFNSNTVGHESYRQAILEGKIIDPEGGITQEEILSQLQRQKEKEILSKMAGIDARIRMLIDIGRGKKGTIKPSYQAEIDKLQQEKAR